MFYGFARQRKLHFIVRVRWNWKKREKRLLYSRLERENETEKEGKRKIYIHTYII